MIIKICSKCKRELPISEFHTDKRKPDGTGCACRDCKNQYRRDNKERLLIAQKERRKNHDLSEKQVAWNKVYYALKTGKISKPEICEICGSTKKIQAHHADYNKPFDVVWCCQKCHAELDKQRRSA